jgi:hypothetical protein
MKQAEKYEDIYKWSVPMMMCGGGAPIYSCHLKKLPLQMRTVVTV